jgi:hypothetical protein
MFLARARQPKEVQMNRTQWSRILVIAALTAGVAYCGKNDLEDEMDDVVEEQQEAAEQATETPTDTAKIREEARDVEEEQKDVQEAMQEELKDKGIPTTTSN